MVALLGYSEISWGGSGEDRENSFLLIQLLVCFSIISPLKIVTIVNSVVELLLLALRRKLETWIDLRVPLPNSSPLCAQSTPVHRSFGIGAQGTWTKMFFSL